MTMLRVLQVTDGFPSLLSYSRGGHTQQVDLGSMLLWLATAGVAIGAISIAVYLAHRAAVRRRLNSHPGLFDALCKVHNLPRSQRTLLRQVVRVRNMAPPGLVFIEPDWLNPETLPADLRGKAAELRKLHKRLFRSGA